MATLLTGIAFVAISITAENRFHNVVGFIGGGLIGLAIVQFFLG